MRKTAQKILPLAIIAISYLLFGCERYHFQVAIRAHEKKDFMEAEKHFTISANEGNVMAQCFLGDMYYCGQGVKQDYKIAANWFLKAAQQGNLRSQRLIGFMYYNGEGVVKNNLEAEKWLLKAAAQDSLVSQSVLALLYIEEKEYQMAFFWLKKAADKNYDIAQYELGKMYLKGNGMRIDSDEAEKWFKRASGKKNASLLNSMAWYLCEEETKLDLAKEFVEIAISQKPKDGDYLDTLGWIYFKQGKYDQALEQLLKASELKPENSDIKNHLGDVYIAMKEADKAKDEWRKSIELTKNDEFKIKIQKKLDDLTAVGTNEENRETVP
jgi:Tfp pilus assembly protein PilF